MRTLASYRTKASSSVGGGTCPGSATRAKSSGKRTSSWSPQVASIPVHWRAWVALPAGVQTATAKAVPVLRSKTVWSKWYRQGRPTPVHWSRKALLSVGGGGSMNRRTCRWAVQSPNGRQWPLVTNTLVVRCRMDKLSVGDRTCMGNVKCQQTLKVLRNMFENEVV